MIKAIPSVLAMGGPGCPELSNNSDGRAPLEHICKIFGYQVATYTVGNLNEFHRTIKFIGAIAHLSDRGEHPLVVHISFDGDLDAIEIGPDRANWKQLTPMISELFGDLESYPGPVVLVLAARGAAKTQLTGLLQQQVDAAAHLPRHVFLFVERVPRWIDTILAWSLFYAEATEIDFTAHSVVDLPGVRRLHLRLRRLGLGKPLYFGRCVAPR